MPGASPGNREHANDGLTNPLSWLLPLSDD